MQWVLACTLAIPVTGRGTPSIIQNQHIQHCDTLLTTVYEQTVTNMTVATIWLVHASSFANVPPRS